MASQQKVRIQIPLGYNRSTIERIAEEVKTFIVTRTLAGEDKNNNPFPRYTEKYSDLKGESDVDLYLSGDMLNNLKVLNITNSYIEIGYEAGDSINDKVEGNRLGSYGGAPDPRKARDFLGISDSDLKSILENYPMSAPELLAGEFENNVDKIASQLSNTQIERIRQQMFEEELDLRNL